MNIIRLRAVRERHRLLFSSIIVAALLLLTWSLIPMLFETSDDSFMMGYLAGAWTGKPETDTIFTLFFWGKIVSSLYAVNAGIPWYTLIFLSLIFFSLTAVCYCFLITFPERGEYMFCLLYFCMFLFYSVVLQFTVVSAYCGVAAVSLLLVEKKEESRREFIIRNSIIFVFMFFAVNIRAKVGYLAAGSAAFVVCLEIIRYLFRLSERQKLKRMMVSFLIICATTVIFVYAHKLHEALNGWGEFREYHVERSNLTDYAPLDYASNQDLFDQIGWSEDFYQLVRDWFLMDESINTETLRMVNERNTRVPMGVRWAIFHNFPRIGFQAMMWMLLLFFLLIAAFRYRRGSVIGSLLPFLWLFVWLAETWYFAQSGRMMERVFEAWTLMTAIPSLLGMGVSKHCRGTAEPGVDRVGNRVFSVLAVLLCVVCVLHPDGGYHGAKAFSMRGAGAKVSQAVCEDYAIDHPENVYICGMSLVGGAGSPWRVYSEGKPYNLVFWGGSYYNSPLYYAQLAKNGFTHLYEEDFFRENVYLLAEKEPNERLLRVMEEKFPGCTYEITDQRDGFIVYQFRRGG